MSAKDLGYVRTRGEVRIILLRPERQSYGCVGPANPHRGDERGAAVSAWARVLGRGDCGNAERGKYQQRGDSVDDANRLRLVRGAMVSVIRYC